MKTSSNNTYLIEQYLEGKMSPLDKLMFETKMLVNRDLRKDLYFQQKTYHLIKMYHRKKVREDLELLHQHIFSDPTKIKFQQRILNIF